MIPFFEKGKMDEEGDGFLRRGHSSKKKILSEEGTTRK